MNVSAHTLTIIVEVISFIAAVAAIVGAVLMFRITKKFGSGIIADGFKTISSGVLFLALGILIDGLSFYFSLSSDNIYAALIFLVKGLCYVVGTYIIVIGTKRTADKLENLTK
jgi:hypothetical protein